MDITLLLKAAILGIVEGATEFLPISSTGHLILVGDLLNFMDHDKRGVFDIAIQLGAMLAVIWEYRTRFVSTFAGIGRDPIANRLIINLSIAFLPLAILGLAFGDKIKAYLFKPVPVAIAFIAGAFIILWAEKRKHTVTIETVDDIRPLDALKLGFAQAVALIPGMSRSGSTIIGGLFFGLSRKAAAEFSFFLAVPTLGIASIYSMYNDRALLSIDDIGALVIGFIFAFISAMIAVRALIRYVSHHDFTIFAWYRIAFGVIVLVTAYTGLVNWTVH
ncbi:undecaprenyl-diphosphate phosphatase [Methylotenera sp.]|uniref:undecaprenyl-diphosphate phosphatase n=1 Tax=Methylotenera sp. TaxID=2051956 RepID=UPI0027204B21|nr:undecaprenyl-diphosphate phosphatase [Methylotenera sp.]MDO9203999.1 undecaprenyl-diphosphate phosphatase [Methylotenera sp.]MDO9392805.1 undecaprenyl-diphosphate phosphatase [Methylotenera sp.]MDP2072553.1 undecaprenyl-diphosphate phosphatase [Methylotenera sp.]MDP2230859.1 undecaprenyl-diphosphate phosphatase [Methylotenera sp.]MDP3006022.1 undecaprenyl-diphosphate phosphatase [Methylotenera sp.]